MTIREPFVFSLIGCLADILMDDIDDSRGRRWVYSSPVRSITSADLLVFLWVSMIGLRRSNDLRGGLSSCDQVGCGSLVG